MNIRVYRIFTQQSFSHSNESESNLTTATEEVDLEFDTEGIFAGYQSPELAAMAAINDSVKNILLIRQEIEIVNASNYCRVFHSNKMEGYLDTPETRRHFSTYLKKRDLLGVWLPSSLSPNEFMVFLDTTHPAFMNFVSNSIEYSNHTNQLAQKIIIARQSLSDLPA